MLLRTPRARAYAMLVVVMLLWAGNSIIGRAVRGAIPPFTLAFGRWLGALLVLCPFALKGVLEDRTKIAQGWLPLVVLGLLGVAAFNAFLYSGLRFTTATNGLLMQATIPALVLLLGQLIFGEKAMLGQVLGVMLSTMGVLIIVFHGDLRALAGLHVGVGDVLVLCGCVAWSLYTVCLRLRPQVRPETFLFVTFAIGVSAMAPLAVLEAMQGARVTWTLGTAGAFCYVALLPSVVAYFLYNAAVTEIGSGAAGQTISLMPLFGAILAAPLLGEPLQTYHGLAMASILAGVILAAWATVPRRDRTTRFQHR